eukprot:SM000029S10422  [mRNA]  locus=s29:55791:57953:+ [translate_table: standard]
MARLGEGDGRWIVQERADGTNVHQWHWAERDCLPWARARLAQLLAGAPVLAGEGGLWLRIARLDELDGDAYVNIRKGKVLRAPAHLAHQGRRRELALAISRGGSAAHQIIPGYELRMRLAWEGEARDGQGQTLARADGAAELPYIADENAGEDPEVKVSVSDGGEGAAPLTDAGLAAAAVGARLREAMLSRGKEIIHAAVATFVSEIAAGGPAKAELEAGTAPSVSGELGKQAKVVAPTAAAAAKGAAKPTATAVKQDVKGGKGERAISLTERFHCRDPVRLSGTGQTEGCSDRGQASCRAEDIYDVLLDERRWMAFTQSTAKIDRKAGGTFSLFDGSVTGVNQRLEQNKLLMQKWRFSNWPDGQYSTVCMTFDEIEPGVTIVKLSQTNIPEEDRFGNSNVLEVTERGWRDLIFHRIRAVFGYGV